MPKLYCVMCFFSLCLASFCRCFGQGRSPGATTPWHTAPVYKALLWQRPHSSTPCTPSSSSRTSFDHAQCREAEVATLTISHHHHRWHLGLRLKQLMGTDSILHTQIHQRSKLVAMPQGTKASDLLPRSQSLGTFTLWHCGLIGCCDRNRCTAIFSIHQPDKG